MKEYIATLDDNTTFHLRAETLKEVQDEIMAARLDGNVIDIEESIPPRPDNTVEERDGSYYFPAWSIEVAASSVAEAKAHILEIHGKDVDIDVPPQTIEVAKSTKLPKPTDDINLMGIA